MSGWGPVLCVSGLCVALEEGVDGDRYGGTGIGGQLMYCVGRFASGLGERGVVERSES